MGSAWPILLKMAAPSNSGNRNQRKLKQTQLEEWAKSAENPTRNSPPSCANCRLLSRDAKEELRPYLHQQQIALLAFLSALTSVRLWPCAISLKAERDRVAYDLGGPLTPGDIEKLRNIDEDRRGLVRLAQYPGKGGIPAQHVPTADQLRAQLIGFNPTEDEFRDLFHGNRPLMPLMPTKT